MLSAAGCEVVVQQAFERVGHFRREATVVDQPRYTGVNTEGSAECERPGVRQLSFMLDLLAFQSTSAIQCCPQLLGSRSHAV